MIPNTNATQSNPEGKLKHIVSLVPGVVFQLQVDAQGRLSVPYASPRLFGGVYNSFPQGSAEAIFNLIHADDLERVQDSIAAARNTELPWQCDFRVHHEGQLKWVRGRANQTHVDNDTLLLNGVILDITDLKTAQLRLEESERLLREARAQDTCTLDLEHRIIRPDGTIGWVHLRGQMNNLYGTFHGTIQDISDRKHAERELRELATTDPLTKLYNRRFFIEGSASAIKLCEGWRSQLRLLCLTSIASKASTTPMATQLAMWCLE